MQKTRPDRWKTSLATQMNALQPKPNHRHKKIQFLSLLEEEGTRQWFSSSCAQLLPQPQNAKLDDDTIAQFVINNQEFPAC